MENNRLIRRPAAWGIILVIAIGTILLTGCGGPAVYTSKGAILGVSDDKKTVVIRHEDFKSSNGKIYMQGMTMEFHIKKPETLNNIKRNDLVNIELSVTNEDEWISKLEKTGHDSTADSD